MATAGKTIEGKEAVTPRRGLDMVPRKTWSAAHYLAVIGIPILIWEGWTLAAWLADGPQQVTQFRGQRNDLEFYAAKSLEALMVVGSIFVIAYVAKNCIRQRRFFTFDVLFCLAGATIFWIDIGGNFFMPTILESSYFVNVTNPCGHMPFVVNPDCGRVPDPILLFVLLETFGLLGLAIVAGAAVQRVRRRRPGISHAKICWIIVGMAAGFDFVLEACFAVPLHLWSYPAPHWLAIRYGGGSQFTLHELVAATLWISLIVMVRIFKNDRGLCLVERGTQHHTPRVRKVITWMAIYTVFQLAGISAALIGMIPGPYEAQWQRMPAHLLNGVCDAPGVHGTRYGLCPGSPGYRLPGRHSLPGESP